MTTPTFVYTVAGSEATGGAGFQVDLKTFHTLGCYGLGTLTCIVSFDPKNNWGHRFVPVAPEIIADQMEAALACHQLDTVKIGMLGTPVTSETVAAGLAQQPWRNVVVDPVLICKGQEPGAALDTDNALRELILPKATVVTPNVFEATVLSGMDGIENEADLAEAARRIYDLSGAAVVAKGGVELPGPDAVDVVWDGTTMTELRRTKVGNERVSGAGCTLAAAITAELAKGANLVEAATVAKDLVTTGVQARVSAATPFDTVWQGAYQG